MSIKFAWKVESLEVVPVSGDLKDVVTRCAWSCTAEENRKIFSVGSNKYLGAPGTPFVEFANLTEDEVLEWVWANGINKAAAEQAAADGLKELSVVKPAPWKKPVDVAPYEAADRPWL